MNKIVKNNYNKNMGKIKKIGLFLSSFAPLFLLIIIKELIEIINGNLSFNILNTLLILLLLFLILFGIITLINILREVNEFSSKTITIKSKQNITDKHFLGYFSLFVLFAVTFETEMFSMATVFLIVLIFIGIVYVKNDMYYINPLINLLGYSFYDIEYDDSLGQIKKQRVFHRGKLDVGRTYALKGYLKFTFLTETSSLDKIDDISNQNR